MLSRRQPPKRSWLALVLFALGYLADLYGAGLAGAQTKQPLVYVISVDGTIDLGLPPFVRRVLAEATQAQAAAVVLGVNTFGGWVDGALGIRHDLLDYVAFQRKCQPD